MPGAPPAAQGGPRRSARSARGRPPGSPPTKPHTAATSSSDMPAGRAAARRRRSPQGVPEAAGRPPRGELPGGQRALCSRLTCTWSRRVVRAAGHAPLVSKEERPRLWYTCLSHAGTSKMAPLGQDARPPQAELPHTQTTTVNRPQRDARPRAPQRSSASSSSRPQDSSAANRLCVGAGAPRGAIAGFSPRSSRRRRCSTPYASDSRRRPSARPRARAPLSAAGPAARRRATRVSASRGRRPARPAGTVRERQRAQSASRGCE